jgi:hypothetical protein
VLYDNGKEEAFVRVDRIRLTNVTKLFENAKVMVLKETRWGFASTGSEIWREGKITKAWKTEGPFDVVYSNGDVETKVPKARLKLPPASNLDSN